MNRYTNSIKATELMHHIMSQGKELGEHYRSALSKMQNQSKKTFSLTNDYIRIPIDSATNAPRLAIQSKLRNLQDF